MLLLYDLINGIRYIWVSILPFLSSSNPNLIEARLFLNSLYMHQLSLL